MIKVETITCIGDEGEALAEYNVPIIFREFFFDEKIIEDFFIDGILNKNFIVLSMKALVREGIILAAVDLLSVKKLTLFNENLINKHELTEYEEKAADAALNSVIENDLFYKENCKIIPIFLINNEVYVLENNTNLFLNKSKENFFHFYKKNIIMIRKVWH